MSDDSAATAGMECARAFIDAFNAQDHERLAGTLNYPHIRLANDRFVTIDSAADFAALSQQGTSRLKAESWDHTVLKAIEVVHSGNGKVHMALSIDRCHQDGTVYNRFETFWIATCQDTHWGIQFRSSYLITPKPSGT
ncbi:MAG: hypothetical protein ACC642_08090 [Pseudomonadales bacterium]